jgi:hypothetical protein
MGDRCNIQITLRQEDLARFAPHLDAAPEDKWWDELHDEPGNGCVTVELYEANYGLCDARLAAADAGIPFYGNHGEGGEYGPCGFVSWRGKHHEVDFDHQGCMTIAVDEDLKPITDLKYLRRYVKAYRAIIKAFAKQPRTKKLKEAA